jgi:hypothetical protein
MPRRDPVKPPTQPHLEDLAEWLRAAQYSLTIYAGYLDGMSCDERNATDYTKLNEASKLAATAADYARRAAELAAGVAATDRKEGRNP